MSPAAKRLRIWRRFLLPGAVAGLLILGGRLSVTRWGLIEEQLAAWGPLGYGLFMVLWIVLAAVCFPVSVLAFSAGLLYGMGAGLGLAVSGSYLAALVIFGLGRGRLRARVVRWVAARPRLAAVDRLAGVRALRLNVLVRLSPLNYGLACYTLTAGHGNWRAYAGGLLASLPSLTFQVWLGTVAHQTGASLAAGGPSGWHLGLLVVGLLALVGLGWQISRLAGQALAEDGAAKDPGESPSAGSDLSTDGET